MQFSNLSVVGEGKGAGLRSDSLSSVSTFSFTPNAHSQPLPSTSRPRSVLLAPPLSHPAATTVPSSLRVHLPARPTPLCPRPASPPLPPHSTPLPPPPGPAPSSTPWLLPLPLFPGHSQAVRSLPFLTFLTRPAVRRAPLPSSEL